MKAKADLYIKLADACDAIEEIDTPEPYSTQAIEEAFRAVCALKTYEVEDAK